MSYFYGIDPEAVIKEIDAFVSEMDAIARDFDNAGKELFDTLSKSWYSPNAVTFSNKYSSLLYHKTVDLIRTTASNFAVRAKEASDYMLIANGANPVSKDYSYQPVDSNFGELLSSNNGDVGMDNKLASYAMEKYKSSASSACELLNNFNVNLSIFDAQDAIVTTFKDNLRTVYYEIRDIISELINTLYNNIQHEIYRLESTAKISADTMSNAGAGFEPKKYQ